MAEITARRETTQPIREKTGGSTFKNPPGHSAWKLVDEAGWRGKPFGGAMFSPLHANFLINTGEATAADLEGLGEAVRADVKARVRRRAGVGDQADRGRLAGLDQPEGPRYANGCRRGWTHGPIRATIWPRRLRDGFGKHYAQTVLLAGAAEHRLALRRSGERRHGQHLPYGLGAPQWPRPTYDRELPPWM